MRWCLLGRLVYVINGLCMHTQILTCGCSCIGLLAMFLRIASFTGFALFLLPCCFTLILLSFWPTWLYLWPFFLPTYWLDKNHDGIYQPAAKERGNILTPSSIIKCQVKEEMAVLRLCAASGWGKTLHFKVCGSRTRLPYLSLPRSVSVACHQFS